MHKSLAICSCTMTQPFQSISIWHTKQSYLQNSTITFKGQLSVMHEWLFSPTCHTVSHVHIWQIFRHKLDSHHRGKGTVTDANIPCADFPSQSMVSNWRPSQHKTILPTFLSLPLMKRGFFNNNVLEEMRLHYSWSFICKTEKRSAQRGM